MRISELINKLPDWCRRAATSTDQRSAPAVSAVQGGPVDPATLPLPAALAGRVSATTENDCLVITAPTSAAAQILRFHAPRLARAAGVSQCRVRVGRGQPGAAPRRPAAPAPSLPPAAAPMLRELAGNCDHERLRQALERLANQASEEK